MGQVIKAADLVEEIHDSILFTGAPGTGKTTAAAMLFPRKRKLFIDVDDKSVNTIRAIGDVELRNTILNNTEVWRPEHKLLSGESKIGITRQERFDAKKNVIAGTQGYIPPNPQGYLEIVDYINSLESLRPFPYHVVILDPLTAISEHLTYMILNHHKVGVFTQPLWGVYKQNMLELMKGFLSLPTHRVVIVHEVAREGMDEETVIRPSIQGSYREEIAKEFSEVYRFAGRLPNGKYMLRTVANGKYLGRTTKGLPMECSVEEMVAKYV